MDVLSVIHGDAVRASLFAQVIRDRRHGHDEWSLAWDQPLPRPLDAYDAVIVFGGAMHADQDDRHPWLREENFFLQRLLDLRIPLLGVCLGAQLIAKATHSWVGPAEEPEIGWFDVELTDAAARDPVLSRLPPRFEAFQWHYYTYGLPAGAVELARSRVCTQAFRLGDAAWGVQFHPEVTLAQLERWLEDKSDPAPDPEALRRETREKIGRWNELGATLCDAFLDTAQRVAAAA
jgi:GMP synthase (glutamine-hydrolysing)